MMPDVPLLRSSRWVRAYLTMFMCLCLLGSARAQQTVFNVPSGDVLEQRKIYGELDITYRHSDGTAGITPRIVLGAGHGVEVGLNLNGLSTQGEIQTIVTPALKWMPYSGKTTGWAFLVGDNIFVPVHNKSYDAGNYLYAEVTKSWTKTTTRITMGAYHFTPDVVAPGNRFGGQFALEQPLGRRTTIAADWYTGKHALGYITPGIIIKLTSKLTWYGSYQIGNDRIAQGNHQALTEFGYSF